MLAVVVRPNRASSTDFFLVAYVTGAGTLDTQACFFEYPSKLFLLVMQVLAQLHPSTARIEPDEDGLLPEWVLYHEMIATARTFLRWVSGFIT